MLFFYIYVRNQNLWLHCNCVNCLFVSISNKLSILLNKLCSLKIPPSVFCVQQELIKAVLTMKSKVFPAVFTHVVAPDLTIGGLAGLKG